MRTRVQHQDYPFLIVQIVEFHGNGPIFRCRGRCCRAASRSRARHIRLRHQRRERNLKATISEEVTIKLLSRDNCHLRCGWNRDGDILIHPVIVVGHFGAAADALRDKPFPIFFFASMAQVPPSPLPIAALQTRSLRGRQGCKAMAGRRWVMRRLGCSFVCVRD